MATFASTVGNGEHDQATPRSGRRDFGHTCCASRRLRKKRDELSPAAAYAKRLRLALALALLFPNPKFVTDSNAPLPFARADLQPLPIEELSTQLRVSRAFVRLCLAAGCPSRQGRLSAAELLQWLFAHYDAVRALAGMAELGEVENLERTLELRLRMANAVITLLEFGESRASDSWAKRALRRARLGIERAIDAA
jgi:hypothetical protein